MKKLAALLLSVTLLFSLAGCTSSARPDYGELSLRMSKYNENYAFSYFDMFLYEGKYHVYFSLCSKNDIMLSMSYGENGSIDDLTVTANYDTMKTSGARDAYCDFAKAVTASFTGMTDSETAIAQKSLSYDDPNIYFSDLYETFTESRYNFIFSSNSEYICYNIEYFEEMEIPT